ncbi:hypothetical protein [Martelella alba]|uniref:hypothetical protein n=1 Tax=Martelella alba TaxID=2590451 RepID=UPI0015E86A8F|nr:hypothetical protein [Martelella alba]
MNQIRYLFATFDRHYLVRAYVIGLIFLAINCVIAFGYDNEALCARNSLGFP